MGGPGSGRKKGSISGKSIPKFKVKKRKDDDIVDTPGGFSRGQIRNAGKSKLKKGWTRSIPK